MSYYSRVKYTGNGSTAVYAVPFPYLSKTYVEVRQDGTLLASGTDYSWPSNSSIQLLAGNLGAGIVLDIRRNTPKTERLVNFQDASVLTEADLDLSADQGFHVVQEDADDLGDRLALDAAGVWDARSLRIKNLANPTSAQDAVSKAFADANYGGAAVALAEAARIAAEGHSSDAEAASSAASSAAAAAASALDNFGDRYLGQKALDPTLDDDGNPLTTGALYFNTVEGVLKVYTGTAWIPAATSVLASSVAYILGATGSVSRMAEGRLRERASIKDFGAVGDGVADDTLAFQKALDAGGLVFIPQGTYKVSSGLRYKLDASRLRGAGRDKTVINFTGTAGPVFASDVSATTTLLWCELSEVKIIASSMTSSKIIVDWKSMQFGYLDALWLYGSGAGTTAVRMTAVWGTTEATYNVLRDPYIGNVETGVLLGDGGNSNQIVRGRIQIPVSGGWSILAAGTVAGRVSNITISDVGMEYPGSISNGVNLTNVEGATVTGCRFESLNTGIYVDSTSTAIQCPLRGNYFSGCTTKILALARGVEPTVLAQGSFDGSNGVVVGTARGCTVSRTGTGVYPVVFDAPLRNTEYAISHSSSGHVRAYGNKTVNGFTLYTYNTSAVAQDHGLVDFSVTGVA